MAENGEAKTVDPPSPPSPLDLSNLRKSRDFYINGDIDDVGVLRDALKAIADIQNALTDRVAEHGRLLDSLISAFANMDIIDLFFRDVDHPDPTQVLEKSEQALLLAATVFWHQMLEPD